MSRDPADGLPACSAERLHREDALSTNLNSSPVRETLLAKFAQGVARPLTEFSRHQEQPACFLVRLVSVCRVCSQQNPKIGAHTKARS